MQNFGVLRKINIKVEEQIWECIDSRSPSGRSDTGVKEGAVSALSRQSPPSIELGWSDQTNPVQFFETCPRHTPTQGL
jgi:hypothetical protein